MFNGHMEFCTFVHGDPKIGQIIVSLVKEGGLKAFSGKSRGEASPLIDLLLKVSFKLRTSRKTYENKATKD